MGDITATCMVTQEPIKGGLYFKRLKGGILGDGLNSMLASVFSTFPNTTMSQNNGLIQITGVGSRYIGYYLAVILIRRKLAIISLNIYYGPDSLGRGRHAGCYCMRLS